MKTLKLRYALYLVVSIILLGFGFQVGTLYGTVDNSNRKDSTQQANEETKLLKWKYPRKFYIDYQGPSLQQYKSPVFNQLRGKKMYRYAIHAAALEILSKKQEVQQSLYAYESGVNYRKTEGMSTLTIAQYLQEFKRTGGNVAFLSVDLGQESIEKAKILMKAEGQNSEDINFFQGYSIDGAEMAVKYLPCVNYASIDAGGDPWHNWREFAILLPHLCENFVVNIDDCNVSPVTNYVYPRPFGKASLIYTFTQMAEQLHAQRHPGKNPILDRLIHSDPIFKQIYNKGVPYFFENSAAGRNLIFASADIINELDSYFQKTPGYWNNHGKNIF